MRSSASVVLAESGKIQGPGARSPGLGAGGSSITRWALVPLKPKELTAARRGPPSTVQARVSVATVKGELSKSICRFGVAKARVRGIVRFSSASTALTVPASPAAAMAWPILVLTEPMAQKCLRSVSAAKASVRAATSIGSPRRVPVPCASTRVMLSAAIPASSQTRRSSAVCEAALGAVMPLVRPSWLMPAPRITARMRSPSRSASARRLSTSTPTPSPGTKPSARSSKAWHTPVGEAMPASER